MPPEPDLVFPPFRLDLGRVEEAYACADRPSTSPAPIQDAATRCLFRKYTASRMAWQWADVVGANLVVAQDWAGTRPAPTGEGLVKWTSRRMRTVSSATLPCVVSLQTLRKLQPTTTRPSPWPKRLVCAHSWLTATAVSGRCMRRCDSERPCNWRAISVEFSYWQSPPPWGKESATERIVRFLYCVWSWS